MLDREWQRFRFFKRDELPFGWGNPEKMNYHLVYLLDLYREFIGQEIVVINGTQGNHISTWHRDGVAVDIVIDADKHSKLDLLHDAMRYPFTGIGIYPYARYDKFKSPVGLHLDTRPITEFMAARWIGVPKWNEKEKIEKKEYYGMSEVNLRMFNVIRCK